MNIFCKIKYKIKSLVHNFVIDTRFSLKFACFKFFAAFFKSLRIYKMATFFEKKKDNYILSFLSTNLSDVIIKYKNASYAGSTNPNAPIWVCWWTGESTAPDLVKKCIDSIRKHSNGHTVYIIDQYNYNDYLTIPNHILAKVSNGSLCLANFSDYLRVSLIYKYGGLWLDATVFCAKQIPNLYFELPFYTCKSEQLDPRYFSQKRWTGFIIAGHQGSCIFGFWKNSFESYWKNFNSIDYLLFDYLIYLESSINIMFSNALINVPPTNLQRDDLQAAFNDRLSAEEFDQFLNNDTVLYKLSWREKYEMTTEDGKESIYSKFLNYNFGEKNDS